jgi:hypothetical protein
MDRSFPYYFTELFRLIRSRPSQSPDKSGVTGRIVPNCSAFRKRNRFGNVTGALPFFEIALVLVRCAHVPCLIVNANQGIV